MPITLATPTTPQLGSERGRRKPRRSARFSQKWTSRWVLALHQGQQAPPHLSTCPWKKRWRWMHGQSMWAMWVLTWVLASVRGGRLWCKAETVWGVQAWGRGKGEGVMMRNSAVGRVANHPMWKQPPLLFDERSSLWTPLLHPHRLMKVILQWYIFYFRGKNKTWVLYIHNIPNIKLHNTTEYIKNVCMILPRVYTKYGVKYWMQTQTLLHAYIQYIVIITTIPIISYITIVVLVISGHFNNIII